MALIGYIHLKSLITSQRTSASVLNISGRQRMLSQRTALFVNTLNNETDSTLIPQYKATIQKTIQMMLSSNEALIKGDKTMNLPGIKTETIRQIYFNAPIHLNQQLQSYGEEVHVFLTTSNVTKRQNAFVKINAMASGSLLNSLDKVVKQYELESYEQIKLLEFRITIVVIVMIALLILEWVFIFYPLVQLIQKHQQKLTRQNKRLESLNQDLEQFIYAASHDLKTPIRGLHNLVQFMEIDFSEELSKKSIEYMSLIKNRVKRINVLIDGLMRFGAISRERSTQTEYNLDKLVHDFRKNLTSDTVTIHVNTTFPTFKTNPIWINELFTNLIDNAIQHNQQAVCEIEIGYVEQKYFHRFFIKDNGSGIDEKYHEKVFKLFQTLGNEANTPTAGIGLAIVKKIITELNGEVWIETEKDKYFTVLFTIPKVNEF